MQGEKQCWLGRIKHLLTEAFDMADGAQPKKGSTCRRAWLYFAIFLAVIVGVVIAESFLGKPERWLGI